MHSGSLAEAIRADPVLEVWRSWQSHAEPAAMPSRQGPCGKQSTGGAAPTALSSEAAVSSQQEAPTNPPLLTEPAARSTHPRWAEGLGEPLPEPSSSGQAVCVPMARCRCPCQPRRPAPLGIRFQAARAAPRTNERARTECVTRSSHKAAISIVFRQALYLLKHTWKASRCLEIPARRSKVRASGQLGKKAIKHQHPLRTKRARPRGWEGE